MTGELTSKTLFALVLLTLAGCHSTNDEIIRETKKCIDAGLDAQTLINGLTMNVRRIQCVPKEQK